MLKRLSLRLRIVVGLGLVLALVAGPAWAFWRSQQAVPAQSFTLGTFDLQVNGQDAVTGYAQLNDAAIMPGQSVAGVLTVRNNGNVPLSYYGEAQATGGLGTAFVVKVTGAASIGGSSAAGTGTCAGTALANTATSFKNTMSPLVGTNANRRVLAAGASETVCIQATLSTDAAVAPSSLQGSSTTVTFTFHGKQVAAP